MLRVAASTGAKVAAVATLPLVISSKAQASGRHTFLDCLFGPPGPNPVCFLRGTEIQTNRGSVPIEDLEIGDLVRTHRGAFEPIKWIGRRSYSRTAGTAWHVGVEPVCIAASAVSPGVPSRDIYISQRHALFRPGALIPAKYLLNGLSITLAAPEGLDQLDYFQLEFEGHEVIFAEGLAVESLLANGQREQFANFDEYERLYGVNQTHMAPYARVWRYARGRDNAVALLRLAVTALGFDVRDPVQVFYDELRARARKPSLQSKRASRKDRLLPA